MIFTLLEYSLPNLKSKRLTRIGKLSNGTAIIFVPKHIIHVHFSFLSEMKGGWGENCDRYKKLKNTCEMTKELNSQSALSTPFSLIWVTPALRLWMAANQLYQTKQGEKCTLLSNLLSLSSSLENGPDDNPVPMGTKLSMEKSKGPIAFRTGFVNIIINK